MTLLNEIYQAYRAIDGWLLAQKAIAADPSIASWERIAMLNDHAFFVLLFGQLEDYINCEYEQYVGPWEEAAFIHRVNCLLDKENLKARAIKDYYEIRCDIAHGHAEEGLIKGRIRLLEVYNFIHEIIAS